MEPAFTFSPLTPTSFLQRSAVVHADATAVVDGQMRLTYAEFGRRCAQVAAGLLDRGVSAGDRVAALCTNSHTLLELHNAVPWIGAVLVTLNTRLNRDELAYILGHSGARLLLATEEYVELAVELGAALGIGVVLDSPEAHEYEGWMELDPVAPVPVPEESPIGLSYTSGTTGNPKGVLYHRRGAYLQALAMAFHCRLDARSRYLWVLPQFHCNGWCFTWAVTAAGGTHVCLRSFSPSAAWELIDKEDITAFSAAPTVLNLLVDPSLDRDSRRSRDISVTTGGAPPSPTLVERLQDAGIRITHLYGLTETFGPIAINDWKPEWTSLSGQAQARLQARQGVQNIVADRLRVVNSDGSDVVPDGMSVGEIVCRGNDLMLGYYRDPKATQEATLDGWFRTGDLGVMHADGYVELTDRAKDIIISGGENISSVEVERVLDSHPDVYESAVVSKPHDLWGEQPVAFVVLRPDRSTSSAELIAYARGRLAHFKAPREIVLVPSLPKTSTGKLSKNLLRTQLRERSPAS